MNPSDILTSHARIKEYVHHTPVMRSRLLDALAEAELYFKCENFQKMGAFKMRGATNAMLRISASDRQKGVVTHSSGNMAQAVALSANQLGIPAYIVMPDNAPRVKKEAVIDYGGIVTEVAATVEAREAAAAELVASKGAHFIHPSNDADVILGQGTAAYELLHDHPDLDAVLAPVGGGGLIAGTALAAQYLGGSCSVIGAEPSNVDDAYRSLEAGTIQYNTGSNTIADGLRTHLGDINFPVIKRYVDKIICVEEAEIVSAMKLIWERMKIVVEPSSAVPLAAVLKRRPEFSGQKIGIILSGGNVDLSSLPF